MSPRARQATHPTMRVLVVDDEETFRFVMENRLRASGHFVASAPSGEAALERIGEKAFDVMLLDLRMTGLGGLGALRRPSGLAARQDRGRPQPRHPADRGARS